MTPYELVKSEFILPFELYPFQQSTVDDLAPLPRTGLYFEPGLGKTATATVCALYKRIFGSEITIILMPPIIIPTWHRWLSRITTKDGQFLRILRYKGTPTQRREVSFQGQDFILMSMQIFQKDYHRICTELGPKIAHVILDEAQCIKSIRSKNFRMFRDFTSPCDVSIDSPVIDLDLRLECCVVDKSHQLLTGTPLNSPEDSYAYVKLNAPFVYGNMVHWEQIHIAERDWYGKPIRYGNLDLLVGNLLLNSVRKTKDEVLIDLPECIITSIDYELAPPHQKLYRRLVEEQLLRFPEGDNIDATQATALYHALGQIVMQWSYYGRDEALKSAGYNVVDEIRDEIGEKKLIVFGNYKRTNAELVRRFNCPGVWGEIGAVAKQEAIDTFINDPECKMIVLNPQAGGVGIDGLQSVCSDVLYVEPPMAVSHLTQSLSRVHRDGQKQVVTIRLATALGTIQQHLVKSLSNKEALVNPLQGSKATLKAALFGEL